MEKFLVNSCEVKEPAEIFANSVELKQLDLISNSEKWLSGNTDIKSQGTSTLHTYFRISYSGKNTPK